MHQRSTFATGQLILNEICEDTRPRDSETPITAITTQTEIPSLHADEQRMRPEDLVSQEREAHEAQDPFHT